MMCMKKVLLEELFEKLLSPIREVLPVTLCNTLLTSHAQRKSM